MTPYTILHATDLSPEDGAVFAHAVALARITDGTLFTVHAATGAPAHELPFASDLLHRWADATQQAMGVLTHHRVSHECCDDAVDTLLNYMKRTPHDLLVVGTRQASGLDRVLRGSASEALARNARVPTLFVPHDQPGFVDVPTGLVTLQRVLVPSQDVAAAMTALAWIDAIGARQATAKIDATLVFAGDRAPFALGDLPQYAWVEPHLELVPGPVVATIAACIREHAIDLVVMATRGHDSLGDAVRGSLTERVLHASTRPVVAIPLG